MSTTFAHPDLETADAATLRVLQDRKLRAPGERLAGNGEWVEHFASFGMKTTDLRDRESLRNVRPLDKTMLRARYPFPFLSVPMRDVARFCATSGTTGLPVM